MRILKRILDIISGVSGTSLLLIFVNINNKNLHLTNGIIWYIIINIIYLVFYMFFSEWYSENYWD
jgi:hypothetical protein